MHITKDKDEFESLWRLIEISFPPDELRKKDDFIALADNKLFNAFVKREKGKVIAFIGAWIFERFVFIEYFAVSEKMRCKGIGKAMLSELFEKVCLPCCLETEPPCFGGFATRRIEFYRRNGFVLNEFQYYQPAYSDEKKPLSLLIMSHPSTLSKTEFGYYKTIIYENVYNKRHC